MKIISLWGYAEQNLGDDLFFQTLVKRYPHVHFFQYAHKDYQSQYWQEENVTILPLWQKSLWLRMPVSYPKRGGKNGAQVIIGGSIFQEDEAWRKNKEHYQKIMMTKQPVFIMGSNVGPIKSQSFTQDIKQIFQSAQAVSLRDKASKDSFNDLSHVSQAPDLILTRKEKANLIPNTLGISVIDQGEAYSKTIAKWVKKAVEAGYKVTLFSFSKKLGDETAIEKILTRLDKKTRDTVECCFYKGNITETLFAFSQMETMIATRFHATILGVVFKQKIFSVIYSDKTANVLAELPHRIPSVRVEDIEDLSFEEIIKQTQNQDFDWQETKKQAQVHFQALDQWVKGE